MRVICMQQHSTVKAKSIPHSAFSTGFPVKSNVAAVLSSYPSVARHWDGLGRQQRHWKRVCGIPPTSSHVRSPHSVAIACIAYVEYPASSPSRIARQFPEEAALLCRAGTMALKGNLPEKAGANFRQALRINPLLWEAFEGLCALGKSVPTSRLTCPILLLCRFNTRPRQFNGPSTSTCEARTRR